MENDQRGLWQAVLGELEVSLSRANFTTWFKNTAILSSQDGYVVVAVPNIFTKEWLQTKYHDQIKSALEKILGQIKAIEYRVGSPVAVAEAVAAEPGLQIEAVAVAPIIGQGDIVSADEGGLNPKYNFDTFVVGENSRLAYAACQTVAKRPGKVYNPLFIYGGSGLGKTHLMQAVGNEIKRQNPEMKITYATSEAFTNEFIDTILKKRSPNSSFADKYRKVDVLIIDDIQFLAGKEGTQEEFFHTFNSLHQYGKQIILSSDRPPKAIADIDDRLRSRFEGGMTCDIQPPNLETRSAIIQAKAAAYGIPLPREVIDYIAKHIQHNVREIEGALNRVMAYAELGNTAPTIGLAQTVLANILANPRRKTLTAPQLIERVASYYDLRPEDLTGIKRDKEIVVPRQIAMFLMRHELSLSYPKISKQLGGRDHTTAMHGIQKIESQLDLNESLKHDLIIIKERLYIN